MGRGLREDSYDEAAMQPQVLKRAFVSSVLLAIAADLAGAIRENQNIPGHRPFNWDWTENIRRCEFRQGR
jgi:hypothetical protein